MSQVTTLRLGTLALATVHPSWLVLREVVLSVDRRPGGTIGLAFSVPAVDWEHIEAGGLLGLDRALTGPCFGGAFEPTLNIDIATELDPAVAIAFAGRSPMAIAGAILGAAPADPVIAARCWLARAVTQNRGRLSTGFRIESWSTASDRGFSASEAPITDLCYIFPNLVRGG